MGALAQPPVGRYLNDHFASAYQKVGTFRIMPNGQKMGGNVASYFCLPNGRVLHVVAGPVDADVFLREARWAVDLSRLAQAETKGNAARFTAFIRDAHAERLRVEHNNNVPSRTVVINLVSARGPARAAALALTANPLQARVHSLIIQKPRAMIDQIYKDIFEKVLGERVSTLPVIK